MSSELERWGNPNGGLIPSRDERAHSREMQKVVRETKLNGFKVDAEAALTGHIMERAVDIDDYRKQLANGDPVLDAVLTRIEVQFVDKAAQIQRRSGSIFG